jgi:hypothetical protein
MSDPTSRLAIRSAAQRLHDDAADPAYTELVPATLEAMQDALTTLRRTVEPKPAPSSATGPSTTDARRTSSSNM